MRRTRSAILAFCVVAVFADAASAQVAALPPTNVPAAVVTADVGADAAGVGVRAEATVDTSGGPSGSPAVGGAAKTGAVGVEVAAGAGDGSEGAPVALDIRVSIGTSARAPRAPKTAGTGEQPSDRSETPKAETPKAPPREGAPTSRRATAPAPARKEAAGAVVRELPERGAAVAMSLQTRADDARSPVRPAGDEDANPGGGAPEEAGSSSGGVSSAATILSLAVLLIPLASWAFEQAAAGSPRTSLISLLERPG